jgi:hypothetical protein
MQFTTAKGSTYRVTDSGSTIRDKAARPEHPGAKERGVQPESDQTFYVTVEDANKLGEIQAQGAGVRSIQVLQGNRAAMRFEDGPNKGKFERRTLVPIQRTPVVGLIPVETWKNGTRVHFGNTITKINDKVGSMNPTFEEVDDVTDDEVMEAFTKEKETIYKSIRDWSHALKMMYGKAVVLTGDAFNAKARFKDSPGIIGRWNGHHGVIYDEVRADRPDFKDDDDAPAPPRRGGGFGRRGVDFSDDDGFYMEGIERMNTPEFSLLKEMSERHTAVEATPIAESPVEEVVSEMSKKTLKSYIKKAAVDIEEKAPAAKENATNFPHLANYEKRQVEKRKAGIEKAVDKVSEGVVTELSKTHLKNYIKKAVDDVDSKSYIQGTFADNKSDPAERAKAKTEKKIEKRKAGIELATDKL